MRGWGEMSILTATFKWKPRLDGGGRRSLAVFRCQSSDVEAGGEGVRCQRRDWNMIYLPSDVSPCELAWKNTHTCICAHTPAQAQTQRALLTSTPPRCSLSLTHVPPAVPVARKVTPQRANDCDQLWGATLKETETPTSQEPPSFLPRGGHL